MSLKEKLLEELKSAMRDRDEIRKNAVQMVRAAVLQVEKDNKIVLEEEGILDIIAKELKKRKDSMPDFEKSGRQDLIDSLNAEINYLKGYLPEQMSENELETVVREVILNLGATSMRDIGKIMQEVMPKIKEKLMESLSIK